MYIVKDKTLGDCVFANGFTRKYFKTITVSDEREWENPAISELGTLGGSTFACAATGDRGNNGINVAFDKNQSTSYLNRCGSGTGIEGVYSGGFRNVQVSEIYLRGFEPYTYQKEVEATADDYDRYEDHINILRGEVK